MRNGYKLVFSKNGSGLIIMSTTRTDVEQEQFCNGCEAVLDGYYHYGCPYCGFNYCYSCFEKILIAEIGCPNCLGPLWL
jgi:hypothetical protein